MKKILFAVGMMIAATAAFAQDKDINVEFEGRYWFPSLSAEARATVGNLEGTVIDVDSDLGLEDRDLPHGRFTWYTGPKSRLFLDYTERSFRAERILQRPITFRGTTFDVNARVATDLDLAFARLGWAWEFITSGDGAFKLGTLLEARAVSAKMSIEGQVNAQAAKAERDIRGGLPTIGLAMDINPHKTLNIFAMVAGIPDTKYGHFLDAEAGLKVIPFKNFSISGGYRYEEIKVEKSDGDDFIKVKFSGPLAGASLRF